MGGHMAKKTDEGVTEEDATAVEKLNHEAEQAKREEELARVSEVEAEPAPAPAPAPAPEEIEDRQLSAGESTEASEHAHNESTENHEVSPEDSADTKPEGTGAVGVKTNRLPLIKRPWWKRRKVIIPLAIGIVLLVAALLQLLEPVRFATFGWVQRPVTLTAYDTTSKAPLDSVTVTIDGKNYTTDTKGTVNTNVAVGRHEARLVKENYKTVTIPLSVDVFSTVQARSDLTPTGKPVTITVKDQVTGKPIAGAVLDGNTKTLAKTDAKGIARVVVPLDKKSLAVKAKAAKYLVRDATVTLETTDIQLVPEGSVHFLSKASGKIDVVKTNLDGSERKVVLAGTGAEEDRETTLLASRDWKVLMLLSRRDASKPAGLTMIDAVTGTTKAVDQSAANLQIVGWSGHSFVYRAYVPGSTGPGSQQLKAYNTDTGKVVMLDQNQTDAVSGQQNALWENIDNSYITDKGVVYTKLWTGVYSGMPRAGKQSTVMIAQADGSGKKSLASYDAETVDSFTAKLYEPQGVYIERQRYAGGANSRLFGEVEDGAYKDVKAPANYDTASYPTFLVSPNGTAVFWAESRDGKNVLFTGDRVAENKQEIAKASELTPYGWLGDDKLLVQKGGSELYVTTADALKQGIAPLKIGDYHKARTIAGYGYGYGAQ